MAKKIVALDVLIGILKQVYNKTKEYTKNQISIEVKNLRSLITTNSNDITKLQTTTDNQKKTINGLSDRLGAAESDIKTLQTTTDNQKKTINGLSNRLGTAESDIKTLQTTTDNQKKTINGLSDRLGAAESDIGILQEELATVKSNVAGLVYDYLGNDEIDKVFEEAEKGA